MNDTINLTRVVHTGSKPFILSVEATMIAVKKWAVTINPDGDIPVNTTVEERNLFAFLNTFMDEWARKTRENPRKTN